MKANEYIKKYGIDCASDILKHNEDLMNLGFFKDLKRLVESHELVETKGGLESAKNIVKEDFIWCMGGKRYLSPLEKAIADVESCQKEGE